MNIDEAVDTICKAMPVRNIFIIKRYVQLGGWHNRFVPKECYYPDTGTAETSLFIIRARDETEGPEIRVSVREDSDYVSPLIFRGIDYLRRKLSF
jgi:hypothetical protein